MKAKIKEFSILGLSLVVASLAVYPLRHKFFNGLGFNITTLLLELLVSMRLLLSWFTRMTVLRYAALGALGVVLSASAYVVASVFLDNFGIEGLKADVGHEGVFRYVANVIFFSVLSLGWVQFPLGVFLYRSIRKYLLRVSYRF